MKTFLTLLLCACACASQAKLEIQGATAEIRGADANGEHWTLRYRTWGTTHFAAVGTDRAFFSNGRSLRWIDTRQGLVLARWLLPMRIEGLSPAGPDRPQTVRISIWTGYNQEEQQWTLDPEHPNLPRLPPYMWSMEQAFAGEPADPPNLTRPFRAADIAVLVARREEILAGRREMLRRDAVSPWFHVAVARTLKSIHGVGAIQPQSGSRFTSAIQPQSGSRFTGGHEEFLAAADCCTASSDFLELFALSSALLDEHEPEASEIAFQNGLKNYRAFGMDPRLFMDNTPNFLYPVTWRNIPVEYHAIARERLFQLAPYSGAGLVVFPLEAAFDAQQHRTAEAQLWQRRADDARAHSLAILEPMVERWLDRPLRWAGAGILAAIVYVLVLFTKYWSQGREDIAMNRRQEGPGGNFRFARVEYWTWTERVSFLLIVAAGWAALGIAGAHHRAWMRLAIFMPAQSRYGSFAGDGFARFLDNAMPDTPEREMLREIGRRQFESGEMPATVPTPTQIERAFVGGGAEKFPLWAAGGPIEGSSFLTFRNWIGGQPLQMIPMIYAGLLPFALAVFLMPQWPPRTGGKPRAWPRILREVIVPGSSPVWSFLGGLVLMAWCEELIVVALVHARQTVEVFAFDNQPTMQNYFRNTYNYTGPFPAPPTLWSVAQWAIAVFAVNALLVIIVASFRRSSGVPARDA